MKNLLLTEKEINMLRIAIDSYIEFENEELKNFIDEGFSKKHFLVKEKNERIKLLKSIIEKAV